MGMNKKNISPISLRHLADWGKAVAGISASRLRKRIGAVWMDSRKVVPGDIFLALQGESDDGHTYVPAAFRAGALAAIVSKRRINEFSLSEQKKCLVVSDPLTAVQKMAAAYRRQLDIPVIALTGSTGKTTTRQFITAVLSQGFSVGKTAGNWNNHIGVPLSILRLNGKENLAVLELGANHTNEINTLTRIVEPDVAIITNIGYAHIGYFGSLDAIAEAKFEIVNGMRKRNGILLLNGDDSRLVKKNRERGQKAVFFGCSPRCAIRAEDISVTKKGKTMFSVKGHRYTLSMPGRHFIYSALPAIFLARQLGIAETETVRVLRALKPDPMRGRIVKKSGVTFIVDCYNANPSSMQSGISLLQDVARGDHRCAIVGDMLELGKYSTRCHKQLGKRLAQAGVKKIIAVGQQTRAVAEGAMQQGMKASQIMCRPDAESATAAARQKLKQGDTVLLKGSRGVKLETVFQKF